MLLDQKASLHRSQRSTRELERLAKDVYPETVLLRQVNRVGLHIALRCALTVEDPGGIQCSRSARAYFGLRPKRHQCGARDPEMRITKAGDREVRRLVPPENVVCAPYGRIRALFSHRTQLCLRVYGACG